MISGQEIARSLTGSWLFLQNRPEGLRWFDRSIEGFWRSFGVFFLLLPFFWISGMAEKKLILEETELVLELFPNGSFWGAQLTTFGLDWILLPIVLGFLARPIGISRGYVDFIIVRNWSSLLAAFPYVVAGLLYLAGIIPAGIMVLMSLCVLAVVLWYRFNITRITLQTGISLTLGIIVLDTVLSLLISEVVGRLWN
ncbi:hypothetical protein [uncultured Roseibium sp.]|uniref:hypothetical protein n=1 Tax=uncultured Roseibium sp. TaxID=1936171 RepID=UPI003216F29B